MQELAIPLPSVFVANLLENGGRPGLSDNADVSAYIVERALADLGGAPITEPSEENNLKIARMMAAEAIWNVTRGEHPTSLDWYTRSIEDMIRVAALMHPEIRSDEAAASHPSGLFKSAKESQCVFFAATAITSQNNKVHENMRYSLEQYRHFLSTGAFQPKGYGANGGAISYNLERFNLLHERAGRDLGRVSRLLSMKMKMSDLRRVAAKNGIRIAASEMADETTYGSVIFGPKIGGSFYQNLIGNARPVTIDLWMMRTWGRYTGTLVRGEAIAGTVERLAKGLGKSIKSPAMRDLMEREGVLLDPACLSSMERPELLSYCRDLKLFWERIRRGFVRGKVKEDMTEKARKVMRSNRDASELKQKLAWPLAAESIADALGYPVDSPRSAGQRKWIREVVSLALDILDRRGYKMTAADLQATLWYPEKLIYGTLSQRSAEQMNASYDEAMIRLAKNEGYSDDEIDAALQSDAHGRRIGRGIPEASRRGGTGEPVRLFG
jgi:hypothetical protein